MKLHLPIAILATLITTVYAEDILLTEDTTYSAPTQIDGSMSYTSADSANKVDLTITGATTLLYYLGANQTLSFDGLDTFSMINNNAKSDESGLIRGNKNSNGYISMSDNNKVVLDNNDSIATGSNMYGGVLRTYQGKVNINRNQVVEITNNNYTTEASSNSNTYGGAIYVTGNGPFNMSNNGSITISGNSLTSKATAHGGAVDIGQVSNTEVLKWDSNGSITISGNTAEGNQARGGALHAKSAGTISNTTGTISFSGNKAYSAGSTAFGGAISLEGYGAGALSFKDNNIVEFKNNLAQGKAYTYNDPAAGGAALHGINGTSYSFTGNKEVNFIGNVASNANGKAIGGAIYATSTGSVVSIAGNDSVTFSGNGIVANGAQYAFGGAVYTKGGFSIRDNDNVVFEKNYEKAGDSYRLRSIYAGDTSSYNPAKVNLSLSAANNGKLIIKDSILVSGDLNLNEAYNGKEQKGTIVFSGISTEDDLNAIIAANTAEGETARTASDDEIELSRTSVVEGIITLNAGTLSLQDGAILQATKVIIAAGATLEITTTSRVESEVMFLFGDASTDSLVETTLDADLYMQENSVLKLSDTTFNMNGHDLIIEDNVTFLCEDISAEGGSITLFGNVGSVKNSNGEAVEEITVNGFTVSVNNENGNVVVDVPSSIPEPTTATLSLLALAGLCARRRRK